MENQIIVYQPNETMRLDVRVENETVWLNQQQMAVLFGRERSVVAKHIRNAFKEGELDPTAVCAKIAQVQNIDSWVETGMLDMLVKKRRGVVVEVVTFVRGNKVADSDVAKFNAQYGGLSVKTSVAA